MIIVTGAAGFIGSCLIQELLTELSIPIIAVDDFSNTEKQKNLTGKSIHKFVRRDVLDGFINENYNQIQFVFHIGARTDTTEFNVAVFDKLNLHYSQNVWHLCCKYQIPLVYASSAATYGAGELGYDDNHDIIPKLKPLNPYGDSKNDFDKWALKQDTQPPYWAGLKFFNVYGPNEYHKGRMASVIWHSYLQIKNVGSVKLFKSHRPDFKDGQQLRDFVFVKDVISVCMFLYKSQKQSGIYNLGSGKARSFADLATFTFNAMKVPVNIVWIDMPEDIRNTYQYYTQANMMKLISIGYNKPFYSLDDGVYDYVTNYLLPMKYF
jgi:ADP-L-glycero-D-manno-heptose 6-epimerase